MLKTKCLVVLLFVVSCSIFLFGTVQASNHSGKVVNVHCSNGDTIAKALQKSDDDPITIKIHGVCYENVDIVQDDVTLIAASTGAMISGPDPSLHTVNVRASRILIDGMIITGGKSGVTVNGSASILNSLVRNTGYAGIIFYHGGKGLVNNCEISNNPVFGIYMEDGSATVTNSTVSSNGSVGINVTLGSGARIGITDTNTYAGNTIADNKSDGILVASGAHAWIGGNTIRGNGTDLSAALGQFGISVDLASAKLVGYNTVTGNAGSGVFARSSIVVIGEAAFGLPITGTYANVITGNGTLATTKGGVYGFLHSAFDIRSATISNNVGNGINLTTRSSARVFDSTIGNNVGNGIQMSLGGGLVLQSPPAVITGNSGYGLICYDAENSYYGDVSGISGNIAGQVSCSGF